MSNSISFVGRLAADAELKHVGDNSVLEFRVANNVGFGDKQVTNWFRCNLWGKQAERIEQYMTKGKQVYISGELTLRPYTTKDGVEKMSVDIRVGNLDFVGGSGSESQDQPAPRTAPAPAPQAGPSSEDPEDLPF